MIHLSELIKEYNYRYKTHHTTEKQMIADCYYRRSIVPMHSLQRAADILGISRSWMQKRMKWYGLKLQRQGWLKNGMPKM